VQGCGSVLATQKLDTISFEYSTQQRSSTSQHFIKPRLIARPTHPLTQSNYERDRTQPERDQAQPQRDQAQPEKDQAQPHSDQGQADWDQAQLQRDQAQLQRDQAQPCIDKTQLQTDQAQPKTDQAQWQSDQAEPERVQAPSWGDNTHTVSGEQSDATEPHSCPQMPSPEGGSVSNDTSVYSGDTSCQLLSSNECSEEDALKHWLWQLHLRYFTPREVANLHSRLM